MRQKKEGATRFNLKRKDSYILWYVSVYLSTVPTWGLLTSKFDCVYAVIAWWDSINTNDDDTCLTKPEELMESVIDFGQDVFFGDT